ncbi:bestrophin-like domain [Nocardia xishanensis]
MALEFLVPVAAAVSALTVFVVGDRLRPQSWRQTSDEASGTLVLDLIKTFFTAVVAFVVVICWQQYQNAHNHTIAESKALVDTYAAAQELPAAGRQLVQSSVRAYTQQVVTGEWSVMDTDHKLSPSTQDTFDTLRADVAAMPANDAAAETLTGLDRVAQARHDRAMDAGGGVPGFLYLALCFGTVLLLLSPVLSGLRVTKRSVAMTVLLGVVVGAAVLAIHNLDRPFSGGNRVPRDAYEYAQSRFEQIGEHTPNSASATAIGVGDVPHR